MKTKDTILSQNDLTLLEALVLRHGRIVTFEQIQAVASDNATRNAVRQRVARMSKAGWLVRLKRGVYLVVTDVSTLGFADVSDLVIAQTLNADAYISFERALQYHGMFDQMLARVDCVTQGATKSYKVLQTTYTFAKVKRELYFGFTQEAINGQPVKIAEPEKTILDILYFRTSTYAVSLVVEKLQTYQEDLDFDKLKGYTLRYSLGIVRKVGFLLDHLGIDTAELMRAEVRKSSYNRLTQEADQFNAKWRLYYDPHLIG